MAPREFAVWIFLLVLLVPVRRLLVHWFLSREMTPKETTPRGHGDKTQAPSQVASRNAQQTDGEQATRVTAVQADQAATQRVSRSDEGDHVEPKRATGNQGATVDDSASAKTPAGSPSLKRVSVKRSASTKKATKSPSSKEVKPIEPSDYIEVLLEPGRWGAYEPYTGKIYQGRVNSKLEEISLEQGIAYLAKNPDTQNVAKIIRLMVNKYPFEKIYGLFASSMGFDANSYVYLGDVIPESQDNKPQNFVTRLYQRKQDPETYCIAGFISNVPVEAIEYDDVLTEVRLHQFYDDKNADQKKTAEILEQKFPYEPMMFSGTHDSPLNDPYSEGDVMERLPQMSPPRWNLLCEFAETFFKGSRPVFQEPSPDLNADRIRGLRLLVELISAVDDRQIGGGYSFMDKMHVKEDQLQIELSHYETSCYDGGSGGTWDHYCYLYLQRTDQDWEWIRIRYGLSKVAQEYVERKISLRKPLPGEGCEYAINFEYGIYGLRTFKDVYLKNPFGLVGVYRLYLENEMY